MAKRGQSPEFLRALRKKYKIGEYSPRKALRTIRKIAKARSRSRKPKRRKTAFTLGF